LDKDLVPQNYIRRIIVLGLGVVKFFYKKNYSIIFFLKKFGRKLYIKNTFINVVKVKPWTLTSSVRLDLCDPILLYVSRFPEVCDNSDEQVATQTRRSLKRKNSVCCSYYFLEMIT
jgi:hypothetical protein